MEDDKRNSSNSDGGDAVEQETKADEISGRLQEEIPRDGESSGGESGVAEEDLAKSGSSLAVEHPASRSSSRTPFTTLSQIDADLALARTLQEQERAYMMLSMNNDASDYGSWEHDGEDDFDDPIDDDGDDDEEEEDNDEDEYDRTDADHEEDAFDFHAHADGEEDHDAIAEIDPGAYSSDEAYARALQVHEERDLAARLFTLAGLSDRVEHAEDHGHNPQDAWEEVDPDELTYEELLALGEVAGSESRGLSADSIASLLSINYKSGSSQNGTNDLCVICRLDFEDGDNLIVLSCKHSYHSDCINNWLKINKVCPVCSAEVSTSGQS